VVLSKVHQLKFSKKFGQLKKKLYFCKMKQFFTHKIGYAVATLICISTIFFFLQRLKDLQHTQKELDRAFTIFDKTNALVNSLNTARAYSKDYILTRNSQFLQLYDENVIEGLQTMDALSSELNEIHQEQMFELKKLFDEKGVLMLRLTDPIEFPYFFENVLTEIQISRPVQHTTKSTHIETQVETDTTHVQDNRRFLQRLRGKGQGAQQIITVRQSETEVVDYGIAQHAESSPTTNTGAILRNIERQKQFQQHQLKNIEMRYMELFSAEQEIATGISAILIQLHEAAFNGLIDMLLEKDNAIRKILLSGVLSFLVIFGAVFIVFQSAKKIAKAKRISEELMQAREEILIDKAYQCALTCIHNRRYFDEKTNEVLKSLADFNEGEGAPLSLLMLDIDKFKDYNDHYGHQGGDECLKQVAQVLSQSIRPGDFVARYGGEEFVIVLPFAETEKACAVAERVIKNMHKANIPHEYSPAANYVTLSIGIASGIVDSSLTTDDFIKVADEMLYSSKEAGRNKYSFKEIEKESLQ
jgi:diguanylate cyclase (GGDEF)-like protein